MCLPCLPLSYHNLLLLQVLIRSPNIEFIGTLRLKVRVGGFGGQIRVLIIRLGVWGPIRVRLYMIIVRTPPTPKKYIIIIIIIIITIIIIIIINNNNIITII